MLSLRFTIFFLRFPFLSYFVHVDVLVRSFKLQVNGNNGKFVMFCVLTVLPGAITQSNFYLPPRHPHPLYLLFGITKSPSKPSSPRQSPPSPWSLLPLALLRLRACSPPAQLVNPCLPLILHISGEQQLTSNASSSFRASAIFARTVGSTFFVSSTP